MIYLGTPDGERMIRIAQARQTAATNSEVARRFRCSRQTVRRATAMVARFQVRRLYLCDEFHRIELGEVTAPAGFEGTAALALKHPQFRDFFKSLERRNSWWISDGQRSITLDAIPSE